MENLPNIHHDQIKEHEEAGELAFIVIDLLGIVALASLILSRRSDRIPNWLITVIFALAIATVGLMTWTVKFIMMRYERILHFLPKSKDILVE